MSPHDVDIALSGDDEAVAAAFQFVDENVATADGFIASGSPWWHGWMVRTAFMAGVVWQKARNQKKQV